MRWGAEVGYAYQVVYDNEGRLSVTYVVDEQGYRTMLRYRDREGV